MNILYVHIDQNKLKIKSTKIKITDYQYIVYNKDLEILIMCAEESDFEIGGSYYNIQLRGIDLCFGYKNSSPS